MRGQPWTADEQAGIIEYCGTDVFELAMLLEAMVPKIKHLAQALLRGRYTGAAISRIRRTGIPVDMAVLAKLRQHWPKLKSKLITAVDDHYGVFQRNNIQAKSI